MAEERVQPIALHQEMQRSYLEYAMSVIVGQLPDARDGLSQSNGASSTPCRSWG